MSPTSTCPRCHGTREETCPRCAGTMYDPFLEPCDLCKEGKTPCAKCGGSGEIMIPKKVRDAA